MMKDFAELHELADKVRKDHSCTLYHRRGALKICLDCSTVICTECNPKGCTCKT